MTDRYGNPLAVGDRVRFVFDHETDDPARVWSSRGTVLIVGTVRAFGNLGARCDDGTPEDPNLHSNGFRRSAWVRPDDIERVLP